MQSVFQESSLNIDLNLPAAQDDEDWVPIIVEVAPKSRLQKEIEKLVKKKKSRRQDLKIGRDYFEVEKFIKKKYTRKVNTQLLNY